MYGDSFGTTEDAVPHWPRLDVCRPRRGGTLNSRRLRCWRFTAGKIRRPILWSKGTVSGFALFRGRIDCFDQADDVVFLLLFSGRIGCVDQADDVVFRPLFSGRIGCVDQADDVVF